MSINKVLVQLLPEKIFCTLLKKHWGGENSNLHSLSYICFSSISEHQKYDVLFLCNKVLHKQPIYFKTVAEIIVQYPQGILSQ